MFGSGLESLPVVRAMMLDDNSPYRPMGLYPGQDGVGSGMRIHHRDTPLNLVTLYTATRYAPRPPQCGKCPTLSFIWYDPLPSIRAERSAASAGNTPRVNKLVSYYDQAVDGRPELTETVRTLCQHSDAMILAIDANKLDGEGW